MKIKIITITLFVFVSSLLNAQEKTVATFRPFQISFISPMGTNGLESWKISNNLSINIFAGYNGGLDGLEVGGFYNGLHGNMKGVQLAGYVNTVLGTMDGLQGSGFVNFVKDTSTGAQISGFTNVALNSFTGLQASGFANYSKDMPTGAQVSGFVNVNMGDIKGIQGSGFANYNNGKVDGAQISSFFNYTKVLKGVQISFINIADSVETGLPIGFFSYVKNGYHKFEFGGNESLYGVASFKTGTTKFYNIFSFGLNVNHNNLFWGFGYGIGTLIPLSEKMSMNIDLISYQLNDESFWTYNLNSLNKLSVNTSIQLTPGFAVFGGLSWNVLATENYDLEGNLVLPNIAPWSVYDKTYQNVNVKMYPGVSLGIRF
jgi:hypothetical protein